MHRKVIYIGEKIGRKKGKSEMCFAKLQRITKTVYELSTQKNNKSHSICLQVLHAAELQ